MARHLGLFDAVLASDGTVNLARERKRERLVEEYGALAELHRLLIAQGFRRSSPDDSTIVREEQDEKPADTAAAIGGRPAPAQHGARFREAPGISPSDRGRALARLARLLLEAAGVAAEERDDDER